MPRRQPPTQSVERGAVGLVVPAVLAEEAVEHPQVGDQTGSMKESAPVTIGNTPRRRVDAARADRVGRSRASGRTGSAGRTAAGSTSVWWVLSAPGSRR